MRRPSPYTERRSGIDIKMTPMIDVVFLLLIYFVWTASFQLVENYLPSSLSAEVGTQPSDPTNPPPPEHDFPDTVIRILWDAETAQPIYVIGEAGATVQGESREEKQQRLREILSGIAKLKTDAILILHPDADVPVGDVIDVYDMVLILEFENISFAASEAI